MKGEKNDSTLKILKGRWIITMSGVVFENACVLIAGNTIENILPASQLIQAIGERHYVVQDYSESIILPGFINLHTHLEHTELKRLAKEAQFLDWLPNLMDATKNWSGKDRSNSSELGIKESMAAGTTFVVDISYNGASVLPLAKSGLRALIGLETFGVDESAAEEQWRQWLENYASLQSEPSVQSAQAKDLLNITVSPHAPYTVCPALWRKAKIWSRQNNLPILSHIAESEAELDWFESENDDLKRFLIYAFGKRTANFSQLYDNLLGWKSQKLSPVEHLYKQDLLTDNLLAAHAVHIDDEDINILKAAGVSIAHCPNSNVTLKCGRAPLKKWLDLGVQVGLGTDSAASSNNLNLLTEANFATKLHRNYGKSFDLTAKAALELITIKSAQCLGLGNKLGSIEPGKLADLVIFALPKESVDCDADKVYQLLVDGRCQLMDLVVDGETIALAKQSLEG